MEKERDAFKNGGDYLDMYEVFPDNDKNIGRYINSLDQENFQEVSQLSEIRKSENKLKYSESTELFDLLSIFLNSSNIEVRRVAVKNVSKVYTTEGIALQEKADEVIKQAINSPDIQVSRIGMNMIEYASPELKDTLIDISSDQIAKGLISGDVLKQKIFAKKIHILPEDRRIEMFSLLHTEMLKCLNG